MDLVAVSLTLVAAMLLGVGWVLQQYAAAQAPSCYFLRLRLIVDLLHRPRWLLGLGVMISGQVLSAWSVGHLDLTLYEPLLASSLIFALALAVPLSHQRLKAAEMIGAVILAGGVAALSLSRSTGTPSASFGSFSDWPAAAGIAVVAYCFIHAGHLRSGQARATLTGIGTGLVMGISDALTRRSVQILDAHSFAGLLTSWPPYCLLAAALIGMWLMQNSFNAAPLHASLPGITAAEPVSGILLGVVVFGDRINISPGLLALQAAGITALVLGVILVARSPRLGQLRPSAVIPDAVVPGRGGGKGAHGESPPSAGAAETEPDEQRPQPQLQQAHAAEPGAKASRRPAAGGARPVGTL